MWSWAWLCSRPLARPNASRPISRSPSWHPPPPCATSAARARAMVSALRCLTLSLFALPLKLDQLDVGALARRRQLALDRAPVDQHLITNVGPVEQAPDPPQRALLQPVVDLSLATAPTLARRGGKQAD